jgi:hypothetical protein
MDGVSASERALRGALGHGYVSELHHRENILSGPVEGPAGARDYVPSVYFGEQAEVLCRSLPATHQNWHARVRRLLEDIQRVHQTQSFQHPQV